MFERDAVLCSFPLGRQLAMTEQIDSLNEMADLYAHQGRYAEAESFYQRALHIPHTSDRIT
jgi:hypothetical protein